MSRFSCIVEQDHPNLISTGLWLKWPRASVSTCPFQIQHAIFQADELHPPDSKSPTAGTEVRNGQRSQGMVTQVTARLKEQPSPCVN